MWEVETTDEYDRRHRRYQKKRPRELKAILNNLDTYFETLKSGVKPQNIFFGFVHHEPNGVRAIDQRGGGGTLAQTRLYVYPDEEAKVLHIITLGDKSSQDGDIQTSKQFMVELRKQTERGKEGDHDSDG